VQWKGGNGPSELWYFSPFKVNLTKAPLVDSIEDLSTPYVIPPLNWTELEDGSQRRSSSLEDFFIEFLLIIAFFFFLFSSFLSSCNSWREY